MIWIMRMGGKNNSIKVKRWDWTPLLPHFQFEYETFLWKVRVDKLQQKRKNGDEEKAEGSGDACG